MFDLNDVLIIFHNEFFKENGICNIFVVNGLLKILSEFKSDGYSCLDVNKCKNGLPIDFDDSVIDYLEMLWIKTNIVKKNLVKNLNELN